MTSKSRKRRGFTLVELGVVIAVIAVLSLVLISARFFIESAKMGAAVQMVNSVRTASRAFAKRACGGIGFSCPPPGTRVLSIANLQNENLLPAPPTGGVCSPWAPACNLPAINGVGVVAVGAGNINIQIGICVPNDAASQADVLQALRQVGTAAAGGPCGACPGGTACVGVTTR